MLSFWHTRQRNCRPTASARASCAGFGSISAGSLIAYAGPASSSSTARGIIRARAMPGAACSGSRPRRVARPNATGPRRRRPRGSSRARRTARNRWPSAPACRGQCADKGSPWRWMNCGGFVHRVLIGNGPDRQPGLRERKQAPDAPPRRARTRRRRSSAAASCPVTRSALLNPWPGACAGRSNWRDGLAGNGAGHAARVEGAFLHAAQHGPERHPTQGGHARMARQAGFAAGSSGRHPDRATALRAGAPTRRRRSASDNTPPIAITRPPSQISGASGL